MLRSAEDPLEEEEEERSKTGTNRQRYHPRCHDPENDSHVDRGDSPRHSDSKYGTDNNVSRRHGQSETGGQNDRRGRCQLGAETAAGSEFGDLRADRLHDPITHRRETDDDAGTQLLRRIKERQISMT